MKTLYKNLFINALKMISTPNAEITFNHNNMDIEVRTPAGRGTTINLTALN